MIFTMLRRFLSCVIALILHWYCFTQTAAYYSHYKVFGTGDTIIWTGYLGGGYSDEYQRWHIECGDGEAMTGINDDYNQFMGIGDVWCQFMFPLKPPGNGVYPYYTSCNVRNYTQLEYYCYDKHFPEDTVNTFVTALYSTTSYSPVNPNLQKCCKTPYPYRLDYNRCQWKYTHDKTGEHYEAYPNGQDLGNGIGIWLVKCDSNHVMTGMGQAMNPWDNQLHYVWIQCCPVLVILDTPRNTNRLTQYSA